MWLMKREKSEKRNNLKIRIVILMLIALLSNYFLILSEFTGVVFATENLQVESQTNIKDTVVSDKNVVADNTTTEEASKESEVNNETVENSKQEVSNEIAQEEVIQEENTENVEEETTVEEEASNEEVVEENKENIESTMEIVNSYKTSKGIVVATKLLNKITNIKNNLESKKVTISAPVIEGYEVKNVYLNGVELNNDELEYTSSIEENNVIINISKKLENTDNKEEVTEETEESIVVLTEMKNAYSITYVLEGNAELSKISMDVKEELNYSTGVVELNSNVNSEVSVKTRTENEYDITSQNVSIYKGYLYANAISTLSYETKYTSIDKVKINSLENINKIVITEKPDVIKTKNDEQIILSNYTSYSKSSVKVEEFNKIFGEEGYIEVFSNGTSLGRIDKTTKIENDSYVFDYPQVVSNVEFSLNNMISTGNLDILNNKVINKGTAFSRIEIINFKNIETEIVVQEYAKDGENLILLYENNDILQINLEDTESKIDFDMTAKDLITTETNIVTMKVSLKTNEEKYELFRNPMIDIELPSAVENVNIKNINLMYKNGLSLSDWEIVETDTKSKVIRLRLEGIQNEYKSDATIDGTTIIVNAELGLNRITANGKGTIKVRYTNDAGTNISYQKEGKDSDNYEINYVSKSGILKETKLENYNEENNVLVSYDNENIVGEMASNNSAKAVKVSTTVMNNYKGDITNVEILGKLPYVGNSDDGIDLNTNFDAKLAGAVNIGGLVGKVLYSTDENTDLQNGNWSENVENYENVKAFKVVLNNENMKVGEKVEISYNLNVPENLGYNAQGYNLLATYYNLNEEQIKDTSIVGLKTEEKPLELDDCQTVEVAEKFSVGTQVTRGGTEVAENDEVNEGQILKYNVVLTNTSNEEIKNIKIKANSQNTNSYYWYTYKTNSSTDGSEVTTGEMKEDLDNSYPYQEQTIESLLPGETKSFTYEVKVKQLDKAEGNEIKGKILISAEGIEEKEYTTIKNTIREAEIELSVTKYGLEDVEKMYIYSNSDYKITTTVNNISDRDLENVKVNVMLPEILKLNEWFNLYNDTDVTVEEQEISTGTMVTITIPTLVKGASKKVTVPTTVDNIPLELDGTNVTVVANSNIDGTLYVSNEYKRQISQSEAYIKLSYTSNIPNETKVVNGDKITYTVEFENTGVVEKYVELMDYLPYGLKFESAQAILADGTVEELEQRNTYIAKSQDLKPGEKLKVNINCVVDESDLRTNQTELINEVKIVPTTNIDEIDDIIFYIDNNQKDFSEEEKEEPIVGEEELGPKYEDNSATPGEKPELKPEEKPEDNEEENIDKDHTNKEETDEDNTQEDNEEEQQPPQENNKQEEVEQPKAEEPKEEPKQENPVQEEPEQKEPVVDKTQQVSSAKYSISGKVWLDNDRNGLYKNEKTLTGIGVMIYKVDDSDVTSINDSSIVANTTTDSSGTYKFNSLEKGKYVIVFNYDNEKFDVTTYQVNGKKDSKASAVISKELTLNDTKKQYAVTDILEITNTSISGINAGLIENAGFDMQIDTYISKVTVTNEKGTETKDFTIKDRLAKIEIPSKYLNGSNVKVEYKVKVTNNGQTDGYINQIANYLPEGFKVDEATGSNWQVGEDGNLYNSSLNKTILKSGESKEFYIVLTKEMTDKNTGTFKNTAEIKDSTNDLQIKDTNTENDSSTVELLITVKTGTMYYILTVVISLGLAFIAMLVVSKLMKKDQKKANMINKIIIIISIAIIIVSCTLIKVYANCGYGYTYNNDLDRILDLTIEQHFSEQYEVGKDYYNADTNHFNKHYNMQCIEGSNVKGASIGNNRTLMSMIDINGKNYTTKYAQGDDRIINTVTEKDSNVAAQLAFMAYELEKHKFDAYLLDDNTIWDAKELMARYIEICGETTVENILNIDMSPKTASTAQPVKLAQVVSAAQNYANNMITDIQQLNTNSKIEYKEAFDGYGPIHISMPNISSKTKIEEVGFGERIVTIQISKDGGANYTNLISQNVNVPENNQQGYSTISLSECDDKVFYIPSEHFEGIEDFSKIKIRINSNVNSIKARIVAFFSGNGGGQAQMFMRGMKCIDSSNVDFDVEGKKYIASIDKTLVNVAGASVGDIQEVYADKGDEVVFRIDVKNIGTNTTLKNVTIVDEPDSGLTFLGFRDGVNTEIGDYTTTNISGNWEKYDENVFKFKGDLVKNSTQFIYVKYRVDRAITDKNEEIFNRAFIRVISDESGTNRYIRNIYDGKPTYNTMDEGGTYTAEDSFYTNTYDAEIHKLVYNDRYEVGAEISYLIAVESKENEKNTDSTGREFSKHYGNLKDISITDSLPAGLKFVSFEGRNWTKSSNSKYIYNGEINPGEMTEVLVIKAKVTEDLLGNTSTVITNTAKLQNADNKNDRVVNIKKEASVDVKIRGYKLILDKQVEAIKSNNKEITTQTQNNIVKSAEVGDIITYNIDINYPETSTEDYGPIQYKLEEEIPQGFEYVKSAGWTEENGKYYYSSTIFPGGTHSIIIKMKVTDKLKATNYTDVKNTARISEAKNQYDVNLIREDIINPIEDSAIVRVKGYNMALDKRIKYVETVTGTRYDDTSKFEVGDIVTYEIEVKNTGSNALDFGNVSGISIEDTFETTELKYAANQKYGDGWSKDSNGRFIYNYAIEPGKSAILTLKMQVILETKEAKNINNTATLKTVNNRNGYSLIDIFPLTSTATAEIQPYNLGLTKYITKKNTTAVTGRDKITNVEKNNSPVEVEKNDTVIYTIKLQNDGNTSVNNISILDTLEPGIKYVQTVSKKLSNGRKTENLTDTALQEVITGDKLQFNYKKELGYKEYILIEIKCEITKSNMYLFNLKNNVAIISATNRNDYDLIKKDLINYTKQENEEYVRLKNPKISGTVWLDTNGDGLMGNKEDRIAGIEVRLHDNTNKKVASTITDSNGYYEFAETNGTNVNGSNSSRKMVEGKDNEGRIIKATNRDDKTGNYTANSQYIEYYVEFCYNGSQYMATTYSGKNNLQANNKFNTDYMIDSNATEFGSTTGSSGSSGTGNGTAGSAENYETIANNKGINRRTNQETSIEFKKDVHISSTNAEDSRGNSAYSFIMPEKTYGTGLVNGNNIDMLFFDVTNENAETEYLKYINLGVQKKGNIDLRLNKDLLEAEVSIKGKTLTYEYGLEKDGALYYKYNRSGAEVPYQLFLYKSDYYYRYEMYENDVVRNAMGPESELNIDLKYRISVYNESGEDSFVKVDEIIETYYERDMRLDTENVYMIKDGRKTQLKIADSSTFNNTEDYQFLGNKTVFITGMEKEVLKTGEKFDIYLTYSLNKYDTRITEGPSLSALRILNISNDKTTVSQIGAYSTYTDETCRTPAGLIDIDSNAGCVNNREDGVKITDYNLYEDISFRLGVQLQLRGGSGTGTGGTPGDGTGTGNGNPPTDRNISGMVFEDARSEKIQDLNEFVGDGKFSNDSNTSRHISLSEDFLGMQKNASQDTDHDKKLEGMTVQLVELVEVNGELYEETIDFKKFGYNFGNVIVQSKADGKYTIEGFTPGRYLVRFKYGDIYVDGSMTENSLIHNGQDYKSTVYTLKKDGNVLEDTANNMDKYNALISGNLSDARDNEYRRLEVMSQSETMTHNTAEFMKYTNYKNNTVNTELKKFSDATNCFADTISVDYEIEKFENIKNGGRINYYDIIGLKFDINNIDFGLSYRPENLIQLTKKIKQIQVETSAGEVLVDLEYDMEGKMTKSKGAHNVQAIDTIDTIQGFRYINIDEELMQGIKVAIQYYIIADNVGEVETVNKRLISEGGSTKVFEKLKLSSNLLNSQTQFGQATKVNYSRLNKLMQAAFGTNYKYGAFVGAAYYKGTGITESDKNELQVAPVRVEGIIDWIDNDATFEVSNNSTENKYWVATTETDLIQRGLIGKQIFTQIQDKSTVTNSDLYYKDEKGRKYTTEDRKNIVMCVSEENENPSLVKYIYPVISGLNNSMAYIEIEMNAILGAGEQVEKETSYDNVAEISQFNTVVGRRTNFATTIGNIGLTTTRGKTPFGEATNEIDSSGTELVTLTPPTGLTRFRLFMAYNTRLLLVISIVVVIAILSILSKKYVFGRKKIYK